MQDYNFSQPLTREAVGFGLIERYTGSPIDHFQQYILLANTKQYVETFADIYNRRIIQGSTMSACHDENNHIYIIHYGIGSPVAALIAELLSFIKPKATLMLGMCGGLRGEYSIGDHFNPVAAIREEGTSNAFLPERCPALSSFIIQRFVCEELERRKKKYYSGIVHTTNLRFWEFKEEFKQKLLEERAHVIDMECATLFTVGMMYKIAIGSLLLISDLPLRPEGIKTKDTAKAIISEYSGDHIKMGVDILLAMQKKEAEGFGYQF
jgi:AMP nucleosidase